jgi:hypothetical protein
VTDYGNSINADVVEKTFDVLEMFLYVKELLVTSVGHGIPIAALVIEDATILV